MAHPNARDELKPEEESVVLAYLESGCQAKPAAAGLEMELERFKVIFNRRWVLREVIRRLRVFQCSWARVGVILKDTLVWAMTDEDVSAQTRVNAAKSAGEMIIKGGLTDLRDPKTEADEKFKTAVTDVLTDEELRAAEDGSVVN